MENQFESHAQAGRKLFLSLFLTLSMSMVGVTLIIGAGAVLIVRAYVEFGQKMADLSGPGMDTTPGGIFDGVKELARGPGIHHAMFWTGAALTVVGAVLTVVHVMVKRSLKRQTRAEIARAAENLRQDRASRRG